ncbi:MAG: hypothetical protein Q9181_000893 [Wetmoreana brouardii]
MNDPSDGVPLALLKHIHLVSTYAFPVSAHASLDTIVDRLMAAPQIATDVKPMVWMYIDNPQDGTTMLVWQPLAKLGTGFASDGFIWADAEQAFSSQMKGYTVEMYLHRSGYRYGEQMAMHQRRRYRLMPGQNPNANVSPCDPSLWIVHYLRAEPAHHIPAAQIPITPYVNSTMTQRKYLQQHGQLVRKEFMLHDRNSWPTINLPGSNMGAQPTAYPNNVISHLSRQQQGYVQPQPVASNQASIGPPPAKRQRQTISNPVDAETAALQAAANTEPTIYDEEDVSRGDLLDFLTPREISAMRYKQHHEWLGEVFRSPYDTQQIVPGELGLGRKGELETLTRDFFNSPTEPSSRTLNGEPPVRVGRMEAGQANDFTKLATTRISEINVEIEKMKKRHAKRMAKLAKGVELREAEKVLRAANINVGGAQHDGAADQVTFSGRDSSIPAIQRDVEAILGKRIVETKDMECIQKGGLQDKPNESENISQNGNASDQAVELSGQIPPFDTPQDQFSSMGNTPGLSGDQAAISNTTSEVAQGNEGPGGADVPMSGMQAAHQTKDGEPEDWILVNKEDDEHKNSPNEELPDLDAFTNDAAMGSNVGTPGIDLGTTAEDLPDFSAGAEGGLGTEFAANDFTDGVDFGNLETAGEALSGYGAGEAMGMDDTGDLGLDDSAFGDAFHSNETDAGRENDLTGS